MIKIKNYKKSGVWEDNWWDQGPSAVSPFRAEHGPSPQAASCFPLRLRGDWAHNRPRAHTSGDFQITLFPFTEIAISIYNCTTVLGLTHAACFMQYHPHQSYSAGHSERRKTQAATLGAGEEEKNPGAEKGSRPKPGLQPNILLLQVITNFFFFNFHKTIKS